MQTQVRKRYENTRFPHLSFVFYGINKLNLGAESEKKIKFPHMSLKFLLSLRQIMTAMDKNLFIGREYEIRQLEKYRNSKESATDRRS